MEASKVVPTQFAVVSERDVEEESTVNAQESISLS